jgi:hypothetical protein
MPLPTAYMMAKKNTFAYAHTTLAEREEKKMGDGHM